MDEIVLLKIKGVDAIFFINIADYYLGKRPQLKDKFPVEVADLQVRGTYEVVDKNEGILMKLLPSFKGDENTDALREKYTYFLMLKKINSKECSDSLVPNRLC